MENEIRRVMSDVFGIAPEEIGPDASPATIENWDSLKHMQLILALEEELGVVFSDEQIPGLIGFDAILSAVRDAGQQ